MRIGVYGGTFSPVHKGHISAASAFMEQMWLDILYIIPTGISPHKNMDGEASSEDRLEMCRRAFSDMEGVIVSDREIRRKGKSYTVDTLRELAGRTGADDRLFLLIGTDMLLTLDEWKDTEEIFRLCYPVYIRRDRDEFLDRRIIEKIAAYHKAYGKVIRKITASPIELSSSMIRDFVRQGISVKGLVPPSVEDYIRDKGLYQHKKNDQSGLYAGDGKE